jgi:tetratricopeptide (TPR) repeat protein
MMDVKLKEKSNKHIFEYAAGLADSQVGMAAIHLRMGNFRLAREFLNVGRDARMFLSGPDNLRTAQADIVKAELMELEGNTTEAFDVLRDAARTIESIRGMGFHDSALVSVRLGEMSLSAGSPTKALEYFESAHLTLEASVGGESYFTHKCACLLVKTYTRTGSLDKATEALSRARKDLDRMGTSDTVRRPATANLNSAAGTLHLAKGEFDLGIACGGKALIAYIKARDFSAIAATHTLLIDLYLAAGKEKEAAAQAAKYAKLYTGGDKTHRGAPCALDYAAGILDRCGKQSDAAKIRKAAMKVGVRKQVTKNAEGKQVLVIGW